MKYLIRKILFFLILLIPLWSFLVWYFMPKTELSSLVVDKTVFSPDGQEHRSIFWVLTHNKFVKPGGAQYQFDKDYYGFFPVNRPEYVVRDLTVFDEYEIDSLARAVDVSYFADAYGIYTNEWIYNRDINERSRLIYGGTSKQGLQLQTEMFRNRKLVMGEFNIWASPTPLPIRFNMTRLYEADFTGWTGRYYRSLDTAINPDIPSWMRRLHRRYLGKPFDYPNIPGIVLIHESERIVVLQSDLDLEADVPVLSFNDSIRRHYSLPAYVRYPYWFDINFAKDTNNIFAEYTIHTKQRGDSLLSTEGLPNVFPAILGDHRENLRWYFCGDWADDDVPYGLSYFAGINLVRKLFYNNRDELDRKKLFFEVYQPLVSQILEEYLERKDTLQPGRPLPPIYPEYTPYYRLYNVPLPDIEAITSGRRYDPSEVLGSQYKRRSYLDSLRRVEREEAIRTGNYIGTYEDTVYLSPQEEALRDSIQNERRKRRQLLDSVRFEQYRDSLRDAKMRDIQSRSLIQKREKQRQAAENRPAAYRVGGRLPLRSLTEDDLEVEVTEEELQAAIEEKPKSESMREGVPSKGLRDEPVLRSEAQESDSEVNFSEPKDLKGQWHIVIASYLKQEPAEDFLRRMNSDGAQIVYVPQHGVYRISYRGYTSAKAAQEALPKVIETYSEAWIVKF